MNRKFEKEKLRKEFERWFEENGDYFMEQHTIQGFENMEKVIWQFTKKVFQKAWMSGYLTGHVYDEKELAKMWRELSNEKMKEGK